MFSSLQVDFFKCKRQDSNNNAIKTMSVKFYILSKQRGWNSITAIRVHSDMLRWIPMKSQTMKTLLEATKGFWFALIGLFYFAEVTLQSERQNILSISENMQRDWRIYRFKRVYWLDFISIRCPITCLVCQLVRLYCLHDQPITARGWNWAAIALRMSVV